MPKYDTAQEVREELLKPITQKLTKRLDNENVLRSIARHLNKALDDINHAVARKEMKARRARVEAKQRKAATEKAITDIEARLAEIPEDIKDAQKDKNADAIGALEAEAADLKEKLAALKPEPAKKAS